MSEPHWFISDFDDKPTFTSLFYHTVPATDLRLTLCVFGIGSDRWPDGPPLSGAAQGFDLIPVSGVGEAVGGVIEAAGDEKIGGSGVDGTFNKDMTNDEMTFETHKHIVKHMNQTCIHIWSAQTCAARKSAYGEVFVCTPPVAFMAVATVWTRNCQKEQKSEKCARLQMESGFK